MRNNLNIYVFTLLYFVHLSIAIPTSRMFYPEDQSEEICQTPRYEDGKCMRISDCIPENRFMYITEDRKTTDYLR